MSAGWWPRALTVAALVATACSSSGGTPTSELGFDDVTDVVTGDDPAPEPPPLVSDVIFHHSSHIIECSTNGENIYFGSTEGAPYFEERMYHYWAKGLHKYSTTETPPETKIFGENCSMGTRKISPTRGVVTTCYSVGPWASDVWSSVSVVDLDTGKVWPDVLPEGRYGAKAVGGRVCAIKESSSTLACVVPETGVVTEVPDVVYFMTTELGVVFERSSGTLAFSTAPDDLTPTLETSYVPAKKFLDESIVQVAGGSWFLFVKTEKPNDGEVIRLDDTGKATAVLSGLFIPVDPSWLVVGERLFYGLGGKHQLVVRDLGSNTDVLVLEDVWSWAPLRDRATGKLMLNLAGEIKLPGPVISLGYSWDVRIFDPMGALVEPKYIQPEPGYSFWFFDVDPYAVFGGVIYGPWAGVTNAGVREEAIGAYDIATNTLRKLPIEGTDPGVRLSSDGKYLIVTVHEPGRPSYDRPLGIVSTDPDAPGGFQRLLDHAALVVKPCGPCFVVMQLPAEFDPLLNPGCDAVRVCPP